MSALMWFSHMGLLTQLDKVCVCVCAATVEVILFTSGEEPVWNNDGLYSTEYVRFGLVRNLFNKVFFHVKKFL